MMNRLEFEEETSSCISPDRQFSLNQIKFNKKIKGSKGAYLYTEKSEPILDFLAQYRAVPFGHNPDDLTQIIKEKAMSSLSVDIYYPQANQRGNVTNETGRIPEINTRA